MAPDDTTVGSTPFWKLFVAVWLAIGGALMMLLMIIGAVLSSFTVSFKLATPEWPSRR